MDSILDQRTWDYFRWKCLQHPTGTGCSASDFDNAGRLLVSYVLDGGPDFVPADVKFDTLGNYDLVIAMKSPATSGRQRSTTK